MHLLCPHCHGPIELVHVTADREITCPGCGSSFRLAGTSTTEAHSSHGKRFGKFEVLGEVGRGGCGTVYKARDPELDRIVAVKVPRAGNLSEPSDVERFLREARSAAQLSHPCIVPTHEVGLCDGVPYLVSDFVEGITLADRLTAGRMSHRESAELIAAVALALQYAHERGVVHRDIKPSNIMLVSRNAECRLRNEEASPSATRHPPSAMVKILDFGLAKREAGEITMTVEGQVLGTPAYMSPEQARGEGHTVDGRSDVYSLGAVFYQLLTGEMPFRGNQRMLLHQVLHDDPRPPRALDDRVPRDLQTICLKCLQKEPARRYGSAGELAADLHRFLAGEPIHARPAGFVERLVKWSRRRPAVAALLTVSLLALLIVLGGVAYFTSRLGQKNKDLGDALDKTDAALERATEEALAKDRALQDVKNERDAKDEALDNLKKERDAKQKKNQELEINLANSNILLAQAAFEHHDARLASDILSRIPERAQGEEPYLLRRFEWHYLKRQFDGGIFKLRGHSNAVSCVAFSPDGARLATGSWDRTVRLWDARTGASLLEINGHPIAVTGLAFSPDGTRLATTTYDGQIWIWDARTGKRLLQIKGHASIVSTVAFSPDGTRLATGSVDKTVRLWDARTGASLMELKGHTETVSGVAFSPDDGMHLASASTDKTARLWDLRTGTAILELTGHTSYLSSVAFSPDGNRLATGSNDQTVRIWDVRTQNIRTRLLRECRGHTEPVDSVAFSPDGTRLLSGSWDTTARLWDVASATILREFNGHMDRVQSVAFSPDGTRLLTGSLDHTAILADARTGAPLLALPGHERGVTQATFSPDGARLATAEGADPVDGVFLAVRLWDARTGAALTEFKGHESAVSSVAFSPDGTLLATAGRDRIARLWEVRSGKMLNEFKGHSDRVLKVAFSPDGKHIATASSDHTARLWDLGTGAAVLEIKGHESDVTSVAFSPDGTRLATSSHDRTVRIWDTKAGTKLLVLAKQTHAGSGAAFSPDGTRLATIGYDKSARLWDASTGSLLLDLKGHTEWVTDVAFSPDGSRLATCSVDKTVRVWDTHTGTPLLELKGHTQRVNSVAFSPDGTRLVSGSSDGSARLWDARPSPEILELKGHTQFVSAVAFSADSTQLATGSEDRSARVWDLKTGSTLCELKGLFGTVLCVALNADGSLLATSSDERIVRLWDTRTAKQLREFQVQKGIVEALAFRPDDTQLVARSGDGSIAWDVKSGKAVPDAPAFDWSKHNPPLSRDGRWVAIVQHYRVRLIDLQQPLDPLELETRLWATRFDRRWHVKQLAIHKQTNDWSAALYHVNQLLERQPGDPELLAKRLPVAAQVNDPAALAVEARVRLQAGELKVYRTCCDHLWGLSANDDKLTPSTARACVLVPDALPNLQPLLDKFKKIMSEKHPEDMRSYGGLLLRAGKVDDAIEQLEAARKLRDDSTYEDLLLAIAYQKADKSAEAEECLYRAQWVLDRRPATAAAFNLQAACVSPLHAAIGTQLSMLPDTYERTVGWQTWIELMALRREAAEALHK